MDIVGISFLIKEQKNILVDTGIKDLKRSLKFNRSTKITKKQLIENRLNEQKIKPEEIDILIFTHLHFDHLGEIEIFKNAQIFIQEDEYKFAKDPLPCQSDMYFIDNIEESIKLPNINLINGDAEIYPGLKILKTPGHTLGSQSVVVSNKKGRFCIAGDNVCLKENIEENIPPGIHVDIRDCYKSFKKIRDASDYILPSHDKRILGRIF